MHSERKLKNKTILAVGLILFILCFIYFSLEIRNQKRYIDWQVKTDNEVVNQEIKNLLYTSNNQYRNKIQHFINNPGIRKEVYLKNEKELHQKVFPFYSVLKSEDPFHFQINFYAPDNSLILDMETGFGDICKKASDNSLIAKGNKLKQKQEGFEIQNSLLFYKVVEPLMHKGKYAGCIEFALEEKQIIDHLSKKHNTSIAVVYNHEKIKNILSESQKTTFSYGKNLIHSLHKINTFKALLSGENNLFSLQKEYNDRLYSLSYIHVENNLQRKGLEGILFFKDITVLKNQYNATIYRSLLIIFLIMSVTLVILHFSFNTLLYKIFHIQESIDKRLAQKTKELVITNTELNQIFNTTGNSMRLISVNHDIIRINRAFSIISGTSKEDAEGKKCYEIFEGPNCHTKNCPLNQVKNGFERVEQDIKKKNRNGKEVPGILTAVAFKGQSGELLGIIEDFKDITLRVEAEEALKRTEKQFSTFMDNLPLGVFIKDENYKSMYLNKHMDEIFSTDNCQGKTPQEIFPEKYAQRVIEEDRKAMSGEILVIEDQLPDKKGKLQTYQTHKFRFLGADKKWHIGGLSLNITEKKKTELQLKILSNAIYHTPACVIILSLRRKIQYVNPRFTQITGYKPEEVIDKDISILNPDHSSSSIYQNIPKIVLTGEDWQGEFQHIKKNGEKHWELASISPVKNEKGKITHFVVISEDITSRKKTESELITAKEKAEEANSLKTAFLANLSHEIRTPLNAIIGFSNLLLDQDIAYDEKIKLNNLINSNSQNLLKLIDDVIDISKIQSGNIEINKSKCFLNKLLLDLYVSFSIKLENDDKKDIHLSMHKGENNPDFSIITDSERLKQVLFNLIENAIKFTKQGFVEFGYTHIEKENKIQFHIIDSGIGISSEKFDMIYDLFRQADGSFTREYGGTGIGLTIAKKIIDHLNGDIWVQSTPNQGTNIYFTLPLETEELKPGKSKKSRNNFDWANKVVLVADDVVVNYKLFEEILLPTNAKILWAKNGKEAVDFCLKGKIDLVLMDIKMPEMDGFEATQKIKKIKSNIKIIGQTAYAHDNDKQKCLSAGFDSYIAKPIKIEDLLAIINQVFLKN